MVRFTDHLHMTIAVDLDVKAQNMISVKKKRKIVNIFVSISCSICF